MFGLLDGEPAGVEFVLRPQSLVDQAAGELEVLLGANQFFLAQGDLADQLAARLRKRPFFVAGQIEFRELNRQFAGRDVALVGGVLDLDRLDLLLDERAGAVDADLLLLLTFFERRGVEFAEDVAGLDFGPLLDDGDDRRRAFDLAGERDVLLAVDEAGVSDADQKRPRLGGHRLQMVVVLLRRLPPQCAGPLRIDPQDDCRPQNQ